MAKLIRALFGARNGEVYPRTFEAGEECPPELEEAARETGALDAGSAPEPAPAPEPEAEPAPEQAPEAEPAADQPKASARKAKAAQ